LKIHCASLIAPLFVVGCAGQTSGPISPFSGAFAGTWARGSSQGMMLIEFAADGSFHGREVDEAKAETREISGTVDATGQVQASAENATGNLPLGGNLTIASGEVAGQLSWGGAQVQCRLLPQNGSNEFAGTHHGTWTGLANPTDTGPSTWTIDSHGLVDGTDFDPGRNTDFHVVGVIDSAGNFDSVSTPDNGDAAAALRGRFASVSGGDFSATLTWVVDPPLDYMYRFHAK